MGPFPRAKGDLRYLLVSIDYMTKWVEAKAMRTINQQDVIRFMDNILMRFGLPRVLGYLTLIPGCKVLQVNREENAEADNLSRLVQNSADLDSSVYFEELHKPTIEQEEIFEINNDPTWMTPLINYIEKGELPEDKGKAQRLNVISHVFKIS